HPVAAPGVADLAGGGDHEPDGVAVLVDVEPGQVEAARVERTVGGVEVAAGAVVVAGRVGDGADLGAEGVDREPLDVQHAVVTHGGDADAVGDLVELDVRAELACGDGRAGVGAVDRDG